MMLLSEYKKASYPYVTGSTRGAERMMLLSEYKKASYPYITASRGAERMMLLSMHKSFISLCYWF